VSFQVQNNIVQPGAIAAPIQTRLVNEHRAAAILGLSVKTLRWRWTGSELPYIKLGRSAVRYDIGDLENYIAAGRRQSTSVAA
jgi:hypothetical protein